MNNDTVLGLAHEANIRGVRNHEGPPVHPSWIDPEELRKNEELWRAAEAARAGHRQV